MKYKTKQKNIYSDAIKEIKTILTFNGIIQLIFTLALTFVSLYLFSYVIMFYPLNIAIIGTILVFFYKLREIHVDYGLMHKKYPKISDAIHAFEDTINEEGYIIDKLRENVIEKLKEVKNGDFFNYNLLFKKLVLIIIIFILLVSFTIFSVQFPLVNNVKKLSISIPDITFSNNQNEDKVKKVSLNNGNDKMEFKFKQHYDLSTNQKVEEKEFEESSIPIIQIGSDDIYFEEITSNEKEVIKKYFEQIK